jgi:hypothetical protein
MGKLALTMSAALLVLGAMAMSANAQSAGAASIHALKNATPVVTQAACRGFGPYCGPGYTRVCGPYRCWCRPCY